jgi:Ca-activated chloride channel homolog
MSKHTLRHARMGQHRLPDAGGDHRRGAAMVLIAGMLFVFCMMAAITIDYAYMQLVRTEMRSAADAAAKAGAEALARTENIDQARAAAVHVASLNNVGGNPLQIRETDVLIGRLVLDEAGRWDFAEDVTPPNAVRVVARTGDDALHPAIPLFVPGVHDQFTYAPGHTSTAGQQTVEVVLTLDRSGSMLFDMSGGDYVYPSNNPNLMSQSQWDSIKYRFPSSQWGIWRNHLSPPHPALSRWAVLRDAIDLFLNEAELHNPRPRTGLVTWASDYTMPVAPSTVFHAATTNFPLPDSTLPWEDNRSEISGAVGSLGSTAMMGATNLSAGVDRAVNILTTSPNATDFAGKVVILLTDGIWNAGRHPVDAAYDAKEAGVVVHCVLMLTDDQPDIRQVAEITGGRYYITQNEEELRQAFRELARSLPVVLTD